MRCKVSCPQCRSTFVVDEVQIGRVGRCQDCGAEFPFVPETAATDLGPGPGPRVGPDTWPGDLASSDDLPPPASIGRYRIHRVLGRGGMGSVYLAHDPHLDRPVALKVPHPELIVRADARERFLREARAAAKLDHPNFCKIHDIGQAEGIPFLAMAYIEGRTLAAMIRRGEPWEPRRAAETVRVLALALAEAHALGIVHRDLKPSNVMVDLRGRLIIMDFGLARRVDAADHTVLTVTGAVLGTPAYMSPEQAEGDFHAIGPRSDIYSLGVILYELISGRQPYTGSPTKVLAQIILADPDRPSAHDPRVDPGLEQICLEAMARKLDDRFGSMDEFAAALQGWLDAPRVPEPRSKEPSAGPANDSRWTAPALKPSRPSGSRTRGLLTRAAGSSVLVAVIAVLIVNQLGGDGRLEPGPNSVALKTPLPEPKPETPESPSKAGPGPMTPPNKVDDPIPPPMPTPRPRPTASETESTQSRSKADPVQPPSPPTPTPPGEIINSVGMKLKLIPAGEFKMGSNNSFQAEETPRHDVRITNSFYLGSTEVTVGQFRRFVEAEDFRTGADQKPGPTNTWRSPGFAQTDDHPVVYVSWYDAVAFCEWLSRKEGRKYRLPTEAEWGYSCRAGSSTRYWFGDRIDTQDRVANIDEGFGFHSAAPVGQFRANSFGLHDTHGNVWEWCSDFFDPKYYERWSTNPRVDDPQGPTSGSSRLSRGGSWNYSAESCTSSRRFARAPGDSNHDLGFRVLAVADSRPIVPPEPPAAETERRHAVTSARRATRTP